MNQVQILVLIALLMDASVAAVSFAIGRRAAELGATAFELGLLAAITFASYTVVALISGRLSDRIGRRRVAVSGCVLAGVIALACAFTTRVPLLVGLCAVFGVGLGTFWPAIIAWLGEGASGPALAQRLIWFSMAWNFGLLLGFGLTGVLFTVWPRLAFFVASAVIGVIAVLVLLPFPKPAAAAAATAAALGPPVPKGRGFRKTGWLANFAVNFAVTGATALFPQLATHLGISAETHGGLLALARASALVTFWMFQHLAFWRRRLWPLWVAQTAGALALVAIGLASQTWMFAAALLVTGAVSGYSYQASIFFTLEEMTEKGKGSGFHEAVLGGGMFLGPILAGVVGNRFTLRAPYFFCAAALLALILTQILLVWWRRRQADRDRVAAGDFANL